MKITRDPAKWERYGNTIYDPSADVGLQYFSIDVPAVASQGAQDCDRVAQQLIRPAKVVPAFAVNYEVSPEWTDDQGATHAAVLREYIVSIDFIIALNTDNPLWMAKYDEQNETSFQPIRKGDQDNLRGWPIHELTPILLDLRHLNDGGQYKILPAEIGPAVCDANFDGMDRIRELRPDLFV